MESSALTFTAVIKVVFTVILALGSALVLWLCRSDHATLRVHTLGGAITQVVFWSGPTLIAYWFLLRRTVFAAVVIGIGITLIHLAVWWSSARNWHSTASLGPGLVGWLVLPAVLSMVTVVTAWHRGRVRCGT